jgi:signal peptidase II|tara:strand:+ start:1984 stop:2472 length:489 start_codon:yes stop_codon:yes gene_type:complete
MTKQRRYSHPVVWLFFISIIVFFDQWTKELVTQSLSLYERVPLTSYLDIILLHNSGAAFSMFDLDSGIQKWPLILISSLVSCVLVGWIIRYSLVTSFLLSIAYSFIAAGAIGNLIDRLNQGYVVDFIYFYYGQWSFAAFNIADSSITIGVALFFMDAYFNKK